MMRPTHPYSSRVEWGNLTMEILVLGRWLPGGTYLPTDESYIWNSTHGCWRLSIRIVSIAVATVCRSNSEWIPRRQRVHKTRCADSQYPIIVTYDYCFGADQQSNQDWPITFPWQQSGIISGGVEVISDDMSWDDRAPLQCFLQAAKCLLDLRYCE